MIYDFIVFGGTGLQGRVCARDLLESGYSVAIAGRDKSGIKELLKKKKAKFFHVDLRDEKAIVRAIRTSNAKVVVNCAELTFNLPIMHACLSTRRSVTDLGGLQHVTKKQFALDKAFREKNILTLTGCGSTPGIVNVMAKYAVEKFDSVETIHLGFAWDSNIKKFVIPYSIQSIFDEFTQPPVTFHYGRFIQENRERGKKVMEFKDVGKQTVYGIVHSEVYSFSQYFKNKGLKNIHYLAGFPDHSMQTIQTLLDLGFNSKKPIDFNGKSITPIDYITRMLKKREVPKEYKETENIWIIIEGKKKGKNVRSELNCIIKTTPGWESAGSNVDTGRTMSVLSQMLLRGDIIGSGVHAPEGVVPHEAFFKELAKRAMYVYEDGKKIN